MKKIILLFSIFLNILTVKSQNITELNISYNNVDTVNINLQVSRSDWFEYQTFIYEINNNIITVKVCYELYTAPGSNTISNTFEIPIISPKEYILNLEIYADYSSTCNYTSIQDSATLNFTTPLNETVYLGIDSIENHNNQIKITPNPIKVKLIYSVLGNLVVNSLFIYNILGEEVIYFNGNVNNMAINGLNNGVYFVIFNTNKGNIRKRIIVDK